MRRPICTRSGESGQLDIGTVPAADPWSRYVRAKADLVRAMDQHSAALDSLPETLRPHLGVPFVRGPGPDGQIRAFLSEDEIARAFPPAACSPAETDRRDALIGELRALGARVAAAKGGTGLGGAEADYDAAASTLEAIREEVRREAPRALSVLLCQLDMLTEDQPESAAEPMSRLLQGYLGRLQADAAD